jgi:hypothetical protein
MADTTDRLRKINNDLQERVICIERYNVVVNPRVIEYLGDIQELLNAIGKISESELEKRAGLLKLRAYVVWGSIYGASMEDSILTRDWSEIFANSERTNEGPQQEAAESTLYVGTDNKSNSDCSEVYSLGIGSVSVEYRSVVCDMPRLTDYPPVDVTVPDDSPRVFEDLPQYGPCGEESDGPSCGEESDGPSCGEDINTPTVPGTAIYTPADGYTCLYIDDKGADEALLDSLEDLESIAGAFTLRYLRDGYYYTEPLNKGELNQTFYGWFGEDYAVYGPTIVIRAPSMKLLDIDGGVPELVSLLMRS